LLHLEISLGERKKKGDKCSHRKVLKEKVEKDRFEISIAPEAFKLRLFTLSALNSRQSRIPATIAEREAYLERDGK